VCKGNFPERNCFGHLCASGKSRNGEWILGCSPPTPVNNSMPGKNGDLCHIENHLLFIDSPFFKRFIGPSVIFPSPFLFGQALTSTTSEIKNCG